MKSADAVPKHAFQQAHARFICRDAPVKACLRAVQYRPPKRALQRARKTRALPQNKTRSRSALLPQKLLRRPFDMASACPRVPKPSGRADR